MKKDNKNNKTFYVNNNYIKEKKSNNILKNSRLIYLFFISLCIMLFSTFINSNGSLNRVYASTRVDKAITFEIGDKSYNYDASYYDYDWVNKFKTLSAIKNPLTPFTSTQLYDDAIGFVGTLTLKNVQNFLIPYFLSGDLIYVGDIQTGYKQNWKNNFSFSPTINNTDKQYIINIFESSNGQQLNYNYYVKIVGSQVKYIRYDSNYIFVGPQKESSNSILYNIQRIVFNLVDFIEFCYNILLLPFTVTYYFITDFVIIIQFIVFW